MTIDPPGSKDLDQAVGVARRGDGFRVHYAIADLGAGRRARGCVGRRGAPPGPDGLPAGPGSVPLHPPVLSEDAASLLPDGPRAAVLWRIDDGVVVYEGNKIVNVGKTSDGRVDTPSTLSESSSRRALPTSLLLSRALTDVTSFHQHVRW